MLGEKTKDKKKTSDAGGKDKRQEKDMRCWKKTTNDK